MENRNGFKGQLQQVENKWGLASSTQLTTEYCKLCSLSVCMLDLSFGIKRAAGLM